MKSSDVPKVSCLMVTANRPRLCKRAVHCYNRQSHENKELIVVDDGEIDLADVLADVPGSELTYVKLKRSSTNVLGRLRNLALSHASGEYIAQWDDDDWYHPDRLRRQISALSAGNDACCLAATLMHVSTGKLFDHPYAGFLPDGIPGTIMHRNIDAISYPEMRRGEDSAYLDQWKEKRYVKLPPSTMHLFIRCYHGGNTWELSHFVRRIRNSPLDLLSYGWHGLVRGDLFSHRRFQLTEESRKAFEMYLEDSYEVGVFPVA